MSTLFVATVAALIWPRFRDAPRFRHFIGLRRFSPREGVLNGAVAPNEGLAGIVARAGGAGEPVATR